MLKERRGGNGEPAPQVRLFLVLICMLASASSVRAEGYDLRVTVDVPSRISMRDHGSGEYRLISDGLAREATVPVEFGRSYDFRAEGPADFFHGWVASLDDYSTNTPSSSMNLRSERVLLWPRVALVVGGALVLACAAVVASLRRSRAIARELSQTRLHLTEAEARSGLFPVDGSLPDRIGPYPVKRKLGAGGMAVVYEVRGGNGEPLALKLPLPNMLENQEFRKRFARELKVGMRLSHPNLVQMVDVNTGEGGEYPYPFLVMELVTGEPLEDRLQRDGKVSFKETVDIGVRLLEALSFVHGRGIVHRDIKPSNIMMTAGGKPKLMDFGVAHRQETSGVKLTATDQMLGTPLYMAPEQLKGLAVDPRADLYAIGMVLYEMLAGQVPFLADDPYQTIMQKLTEEIPPLRTMCPDVPPALEACVMRLVATDPGDRYATAADARGALEASHA